MVTTNQYKESEIGVIPFDWECHPVEEVMIDISMGPFGSDIKVENFKLSGVPVLNGYNVKDYWVNDVIANYVTQEKARDLKKAVAIRGDIVITHRGTIGQIAVIPDNSKYENYVISQSQFRVALNKKRADSLFIVYFFHSSKGQSILLEKKGHTGVPALAQPTTNFRKLFVPIPPLPEQRAIAGALSDAYAYITALEKLIAKKRALKQGAMQELLTGKRRLPGFSGAWLSCGLPEVLVKGDDIKIGPFGSQLKKEYLVQNGAFKVYGQENIYQNDFSFGNRYLTRERFENLQSCEIKPGDFVLSTMGTIGKCAIVPPDICVGIMDSHLIRLRIDKSKLLPQYLLHLFSNDFHFLESQTSRLSVGGIMDGLSTKIVCALEIEYPESADEQSAIAEILSDMDAEIDALTAKMNKAKYIKQAMMSELLTGRIRFVEQEAPAEDVVASKIVEPLKHEAKGHNQQFDDAVMIAGIVNALYSDKYPLGRKKVQKCLYLLRRHQDESTTAFKKKAAGPYADEVRYKGGEPISRSAQYIATATTKDKGTTFARGDKISQALGYIESWGRQGDIKWVTDNLKYKKVDELELLATVDMAICDLAEAGTPVSVATIKHLIATNEEWKAKLKKQTFSDTNIARAIKELQTLL